MEENLRTAAINRRHFLGILLSCAAAAAFQPESDAQSTQFYTPPSDLQGQWQFTPEPSLPNVLIIGDSISLGYTLDVRWMLRGKANVFRPMTKDGKPENCGNTLTGLEHIHAWLDDTKWSVIHFNWGLWDLCYRSPRSKVYGHRDKIHGVQDVPIAEYKENLTKLVYILKATKATLIWATTTVVPPHEAGRFVGDEVKYNRVAGEVMRANHIRIDDLYSLTARFPTSDFRVPGDVHYKPEAYRRIAEQVASAIQTALVKRGAQARLTLHPA